MKGINVLLGYSRGHCFRTLDLGHSRLVENFLCGIGINSFIGLGVEALFLSLCLWGKILFTLQLVESEQIFHEYPALLMFRMSSALLLELKLILGLITVSSLLFSLVLVPSFSWFKSPRSAIWILVPLCLWFYSEIGPKFFACWVDSECTSSSVNNLLVWGENSP